jgi:hypothetical protein
MDNLDRVYKNIVNYAQSNFARINSLNQRDYALALRQARAVITDAYVKYSVKGTLTYTEMQRYDRIKKMDAMLEKAIRDNLKDVPKRTRSILKETAQGTYDRTGSTIPAAFNVALTPMTADQIQAILQKPVQGWSLDERMALRQRDMIVKIQGEVKRQLLRKAPIEDTWKGVKTKMEKIYLRDSMELSDDAHRVSQDSINEALSNGKDKGLFPTKTWVTAGDEKVRDAHIRLDGKTVDANENFIIEGGEYDGYATGAPGEFGEPALDYNCRCYIVGGWRENEEEII